jgi:hypothetical protein
MGIVDDHNGVGARGYVEMAVESKHVFSSFPQIFADEFYHLPPFATFTLLPAFFCEPSILLPVPLARIFYPPLILLSALLGPIRQLASSTIELAQFVPLWILILLLFLVKMFDVLVFETPE